MFSKTTQYYDKIYGHKDYRAEVERLQAIVHEVFSSIHRLASSWPERHAAWMPQARQIAWSLSVADVVALGRLPHGGRATENAEAVDRALDRLDLAEARERRDRDRQRERRLEAHAGDVAAPDLGRGR